jgi:HPt (histidine-containing phosphotransfer) domain-containing protein
MNRHDPAIEAELARLRAAFLQRLAEDRAVFAAALLEPTAAQLGALAQRAHRVAGAAGSFGEPALSEAAQRFEDLSGCGKEGVAAALRQLLAAIERALGD